MTLETNIEIRKEAEAACLLVIETADALPEDHRQRFWEVVHFHVANAAGIVPDEDPADSTRMTESQATAFEEMVMPWGKYQDYRIGDIEDHEYLCYMAEKPDEFKDQLRRYVRSDRVQREQDDA